MVEPANIPVVEPANIPVVEPANIPVVELVETRVSTSSTTGGPA
ncbi:hypothetical protein [Arthrobacter sp. S39]|nr:hypothetical protein [Arthrobacter sp. S39]